MSYFIRYDKDTGRVLSTGTLDDKIIKEEQDKGESIATISEPIPTAYLGGAFYDKVNNKVVIKQDELDSFDKLTSMPMISKRQLYQQLAKRSLITKQEALDAISSSTTPPFIEKALLGIKDEDERFDAEMRFLGESYIMREDVIIAQVAQLFKISDDDVNKIFADSAGS